tara:strand:- start:883 stop:1845 length:963 start_codon:yes stop_codon:yes gene_type:complete
MKLITDTYDYSIVHKGKEYTITHGTYEITPTDAKLLLETNSMNRSIKRASTQKMERAQMDFNWVYTGDVIQLDHRGVLLNGQHRLTAAVNVGMTLTIPVVSGLPTEFFYFMDISKPRSTNDALGIYGIKSPSVTGKVITLLWQMSNDRIPLGRQGGESPAPPESVDLYFRFGDVETNSLDKHIERAKKAKFTHLNPGAVGALSCLYSDINEEWNDLFWEGVIDKLNITNPNDPRKALTEYVDRRYEESVQSSAIQSFRAPECAKWIHYAWTKWTAGDEIDKGGFQVNRPATQNDLSFELVKLARYSVINKRGNITQSQVA